MPADPFAGEPASTREAIMRATYQALREDGYADLTIQRIGDHFGKSKSLLYHHYDGKDELLIDFLEYLLEQFEAEVVGDGTADPHEQLLAIVDTVYPVEVDQARLDLVAAIIELRSQAAHDERFRRQFTRSDRFFRSQLERVIAAGVADGTFRSVDTAAVADFLFATLHGAMLRRVTADDPETPRAVRAEFVSYVDERLLATDR